EVRVLGARRLVAPWEAALARRQPAARTRLPRRGGLPLGLGRQPAAGPAAVGVRLVPVDVQHRPVRFQRHPAVEGAPPPAAPPAPPPRPPTPPAPPPPLPAASASPPASSTPPGGSRPPPRTRRTRPASPPPGRWRTAAARPGAPTFHCRRRTARRLPPRPGE